MLRQIILTPLDSTSLNCHAHGAQPITLDLLPIFRGEKGDKGDKGDAAETDIFDYDQLVAATLL